MHLVLRHPLKQTGVAVRSISVMRTAGLFRPEHPVETIKSIMDLRHFGPAGGPVKVASRRHPEWLGLIDELGELTFGELNGRANALARGWLAAGVNESSGIAVLCRDHRGMIDTMGASARVGSTIVLMNTGFAARQLAEVAAREGVTDIVYDQEFAAVLSELPDEVRRYRAWSDEASPDPTLDELIEANSTDDLRPPKKTGSLVMLTSGTTGVPKGAPRQVRSPLAPAQFLDRVPLRPGEVTVLAAPSFHGTGLSQLLMSMSLGSATAMRRRFDAEATIALVARYKATSLVVVPTMLQRILDLGDETISRHDTSSLRIILTAGAALPPELGNRVTDVFGDVIHNLYGSTECAVATIAMPEDWSAAPGTVGLPPVGCRVELYAPDGSRVKHPHEKGTVYIGSNIRFGGYTGGGSKDEINGLLSSGDIGHFDEAGRLFIDGRADDMIVSGGENVYPAEVENLLMEHPLVTDAAVIGVADGEFGQRLKAFAVLEPGAELAPDELKALVKSNLARYKVPREVEFLDELPRNPTGKLLRDRLS